MSTDVARLAAPSIALVLDDAAPRLPDTQTGEVVLLADATVPQLARFVGELREMRRVIGDALDRVAVEVAERGDAAGTRTLRADGYAFGLDSPTETVFSLDAALAELRALLNERDPHGTLIAIDAAFDALVVDVNAIARTKITREPDHAAIKRLRARGDRDVNAILDRHTTTRPRARRTLRIEVPT